MFISDFNSNGNICSNIFAIISDCNYNIVAYNCSIEYFYVVPLIRDFTYLSLDVSTSE